MFMQIINLSENNSVLNHYLKEIRSVEIQKDSMRFRRNMERIGEIMAYEISKTMHFVPENIQTPLGFASTNVIDEQIVISTILRAGLPFHTGFLNYFDRAENAFVSAYRKYKDALKFDIFIEYIASPDISGKNVDYYRSNACHRRFDGTGLRSLAHQGKTQKHPYCHRYCQPAGY